MAIVADGQLLAYAQITWEISSVISNWKNVASAKNVWHHTGRCLQLARRATVRIYVLQYYTYNYYIRIECYFIIIISLTIYD
jgi:hypothetical protein